MLAIVADDLEHPLGLVRLRLTQEPRAMAIRVQQRGSVAVTDALQIAVGLAARVVATAAVALAGLGEICTCAVLGQVLVQDCVAFVVARFADQPAEDACIVLRVEDAGGGIAAVDGQDVVLRDRPPVDVAWIVDPTPALDAGEQPLDARTETLDAVIDAIRLAQTTPADPGVVEFRDQVLGAGQQEDVRFLVIAVAGEPLVRLACDRGQGEVPPESEGSVARAACEPR